eukprot:jgi/Ulvmu1/11969/UM082_0048.1
MIRSARGLTGRNTTHIDGLDTEAMDGDDLLKMATFFHFHTCQVTPYCKASSTLAVAKCKKVHRALVGLDDRSAYRARYRGIPVVFRIRIKLLQARSWHRHAAESCFFCKLGAEATGRFEGHDATSTPAPISMGSLAEAGLGH